MTCGMDVELPAHGVADVGMVVAVAGRPPRGDAVDQLAPVGEHDARALGARHRLTGGGAVFIWA